MGCSWVLFLMAAITSIWGPKWFLFLSAIFSFTAGFMLGCGGKSGSLELGIILGLILTSVSIGGGISTRYFRSRGLVEGMEDIYMALKSLFSRKRQ